MRSIEDICLDALIKGNGDDGNKSEFYRLAVKEFILSSKKRDMIKIKFFAMTNQLPKLKEFVLTLNKKSEVLPWEAIFSYLDTSGLQAVDLC